MDYAYLYLVLTGGSEKIERDSPLLIQTVKGVDSKSIIILEYGESGDNPHINVICKTNMRPDNFKRMCMNAYYGKEYLKTQLGNKYLCKCQKVKNYENVKNIGVYLTKEPKYNVLYDGSTLLKDIEDMPSYDEHQTALQQSRMLTSTDNSLCELLVQMYLEKYTVIGVDCQGNSQMKVVGIVNKDVFKSLIQDCIKNGYGIIKNLKNIKQIYAMWSAKLGHFEYMDKLIDDELRFL